MTPSPREFVERLVQADRVRRRQRAIGGAVGRDDAERAERGGLLAERRPDLARERGDRGLAAGAGDGDDGFRLARIEPRAGGGERRADVGTSIRRAASTPSAAALPATIAIAPCRNACARIGEAVGARCRERRKTTIPASRGGCRR